MANTKRKAKTRIAADSSPELKDPADRNRNRTGEPYTKGSKVLSSQRTRTIYKMLIAGHSRAAIFDYATDAVRDSYEPTTDTKLAHQRQHNRDLWDICDRQIDMRIAAANKLIDDQAALGYAREFAMVNARLEDLYLNSYMIQDYKTCAQLTKQKAELFNLNRTTPSDPAAIGAAAGAAAAMTVDEWRRRADERRALAADDHAELAKALAETPQE